MNFFPFFRYKTMEDYMATHNILPLHHPRNRFFHHMATQNILQVHSHRKHSSSTRFLPLQYMVMPEPSSKLDHIEYFSSSGHMEHSSSIRSNMAFFHYGTLPHGTFFKVWSHGTFLLDMASWKILSLLGNIERFFTSWLHGTFFHFLATQNLPSQHTPWNILPVHGRTDQPFARWPHGTSSTSWQPGIFVHFIATPNILPLLNHNESSFNT
jgi:hypothetical protein